MTNDETESSPLRMFISRPTKLHRMIGSRSWQETKIRPAGERLARTARRHRDIEQASARVYRTVRRRLRVFDPAAPRLLVDTLGSTQVMQGRDYPYPLGEQPVGRVVEHPGFLSEADARAIR